MAGFRRFDVGSVERKVGTKNARYIRSSVDVSFFAGPDSIGACDDGDLFAHVEELGPAAKTNSTSSRNSRPKEK